jgi:hypothetical protein
MNTHSISARCAKFIVAAVLLVSAQPASAALIHVEEAYELKLRLVERWPVGDTAQMIVRPCTDCERIYLRITDDTAYYLRWNGPRITWRQFTDARTSGGMSQDTSLAVFFDPENLNVTRVVLNAESQQ